jgi:hypothetical protein
VTFLSQSEKKDTCASLALNLIFLWHMCSYVVFFFWEDLEDEDTIKN